MAPPVVNGISPKEGPPGTRVTIRGENLGAEARDFIGETRAVAHNLVVSCLSSR